MQKHVKHMALLRRMFNEHEWQRLLADQSFTSHVREAENTLDAVERLSILGERILQISHVPCDNISTDPAKHRGPFETLSVKEVESGIISDEKCVACDGTVRRITMAIQTEAHPVRPDR